MLNPKIAVLISTATHPVSGRPVASTSDKAAFELACSLAPEASLTILCAGSATKECLDDYFGLGATTIEVLKTDGDIVPALQNRLHDFDLILCGVRADGQFSSGLLPFLLAEKLHLPLITDVLEAKLADTLQVRQFLPKGLRRRLEITMPAILSVHSSAPQKRQYAHARARAGQLLYSEVMQTESPATPLWKSESAIRRPRPLTAKVQQSGHSRMLNAIGGGTESKSALLLKDGSAEQKAIKLLAWLRERHSVDF